jgi:hypothetical protein
MGHEKIPCSRSFFSHPLALSWQRFAKQCSRETTAAARPSTMPDVALLRSGELTGVGVSPFAAWRSRAARGSCGVTQEGDVGDCNRSTQGSFGWPGRSSRLADAVGACLHSCSQCSRCRYVSVSARFSDCSWFSSCRLSQMRATANTRTFLSGPAAPPWNASASTKKKPNNTACPASVATEAGRAIAAWDPSKVLPSRPATARVAVMQGSNGQTTKPSKSFGGLSATDVATWRRRAPPCYGGHLAFLAAATNRAYARRHGYDYVEAHGDCTRQQGRHPSWCKMVMVKGLRAPHTAVEPPHPLHWEA